MLHIARWAHTFDFRTVGIECGSAQHRNFWAHFIEIVRNTPVFKARMDAATLFTVTASYWLVASIFWREQLLTLLDYVWQIKELKVIFILLLTIGLFVAENELIRPVFQNRHRIAKAVGTVVVLLFSIATIFYWLDENVAFIIAKMLGHNPYMGSMDAISFVVGNFIAYLATVFLPIVGAIFLVRAFQRVMTGHNCQKTQIWYQ